MNRPVAEGGSVVLAGAAPDTLNLGVSALMISVVNGVSDRMPGTSITVLDHGNGLRAGIPFCGTPFGVRVGIRHTRRWYRPEAQTHVSLAISLGGAGNPGARALMDADAILDISGGDSFTDLYGQQRFAAVCFPKKMAIRLGIPLILLPQTYGPFRDEKSREMARTYMRGAAQAWARDSRSFEVLKDLLGSGFDPARHRLGVDVAFLLPAVRPGLMSRSQDEPSEVGVNVSGLIWNNPEESQTRYGLMADYRKSLQEIVEKITLTTRVALVPHVVTPRGHYESDRAASEELRETLSGAARARVRICADPASPCEAKAYISECAWFLGTRMHATIGALSSGVPSAAISYSDKTLGVFETCGQGEHVHDPRQLSTEELVERVLRSFHDRGRAALSLRRELPTVLAKAHDQLQEIATFVRQRSGAKNTYLPAQDLH